MLIEIVKSKIERVKCTSTNSNYLDSITIDGDLMEAANIIDGEKVLVVNNNNGERLETYAVCGFRNTNEITVNGALSIKVNIGNILTIIAFGRIGHESGKIFKSCSVSPNEETNLLN